MPQADFTYETPQDAAGLRASVALFSDQESFRGELASDLRDAGFRVGTCESLASLIEGETIVLGDVVLLDCPCADAETIAALSRLDVRIARSGSPLIVMTSLDALDQVFASFEQSAPEILVGSGRAERMVAIGRLLGRISGLRLRELSESEHLSIMRLTQQVEAIARRIDEFAEGSHREVALPLSDMKRDFRHPSSSNASHAPALPKPDLVRQVIRQRQARARFFDAELFADPAWDMLLDLTAAHGEGAEVSVTSLCIASGVPATTALRWIRQMVDQGIFTRVEDACDRRRAFIALSEASLNAMAGYFAAIEEPLALAA